MFKTSAAVIILTLMCHPARGEDCKHLPATLAALQSAPRPLVVSQITEIDPARLEFRVIRSADPTATTAFLSIHVLVDGRSVGTSTLHRLTPSESWAFQNIQFAPEFHGQGLGTLTYLLAMRTAAQQNIQLVSDPRSLSASARRSWERLVRWNYAEQNGREFVTRVSPETTAELTRFAANLTIREQMTNYRTGVRRLRYSLGLKHASHPRRPF